MFITKLLQNASVQAERSGFENTCFEKNKKFSKKQMYR